MQIRSSDLEIPKHDPFENDCLNRRDLEPPLTEFVNQALGPFVLAIDGSWGSGKTTFLKMWQVKLDGAGHLCLYLNAWKNDFVQDPLIAVVGELSSAMKEQAQGHLDKDNVRKTIEKIEKAANSIVRRLIPVGAKLATFGLFDIDNAMEREISAATGAIAENLIQDYDNGKSDIKEFREDLEFLANEISSDSKPVKIVIIIDELDRCRPTYAVQLLERIKHLFDVKGVVFVLGIDRAQLCHSIKALYGSEFDATGYLKRFIDIDYRLPEPILGSYYSYLFKKLEIKSLLSNRPNNLDQNDLKMYLGYLLSAAKMGLRDQEQIISRLRIVIQTIPMNDQLFPITLSILSFLYSWEHPLYILVTQGNLKCKNFMNTLEKLPNEKEAFRVFLKNGGNKERLRGVFFSGLREFLGDKDPELQELTSMPKCTFEMAQQEAGFEITKNRLDLTSNFVRY
jgi:KAP family P-loop domain